MQLNELIEQESIEKIAIKTTISQDNLNYLMNEDFEKLSRVKSLGFLLILEREYKELEVSELRERVKLYFEDNKPDHDNVIVLSETASKNTKGGFSFFKWFVILGILFGGWYLYTQGSLDSLLQNITSKKDTYNDNTALENNITMEEAKKVSVSKNRDEPVAIVAPVEPKIDLDAETVTVVEGKVIVDENESAVKATTGSAEMVQDAVANELNKMEEHTVVVTEVVTNKVEESTPEVVTSSGISTITINPTRGMLWFGFINVDTKNKKEFMKQVSTPFDIKDGRWILVTGHGFVDIVSELETVEVSDRNKHYFYVDSTELKEISQKEFRELNDGHGWI
jgi:hypothetical protein